MLDCHQVWILLTHAEAPKLGPRRSRDGRTAEQQAPARRLKLMRRPFGVERTTYITHPGSVLVVWLYAYRYFAWAFKLRGCVEPTLCFNVHLGPQNIDFLLRTTLEIPCLIFTEHEERTHWLTQQRESPEAPWQSWWGLVVAIHPSPIHKCSNPRPKT